MSDNFSSFHLDDIAKTKKGEVTRQKLLDAAKDIFGSKGFYNTSVVEITQRAGVAQGTFYVYFDSKKAIFRQLVIMLNHSIRRKIQMAIDEAKTREEKERIGYKAFFSFVKSNKNLYNIIFEAQWVDEEIYKWYFKTFASGYIEGLKEAMGKGELRKLDPECLAYCLMGITIEVGKRWVLWENGDVPEHILEDMVNFIFHGMLASKS